MRARQSGGVRALRLLYDSCEVGMVDHFNGIYFWSIGHEIIARLWVDCDSTWALFILSGPWTLRVNLILSRRLHFGFCWSECGAEL